MVSGTSPPSRHGFNISVLNTRKAAQTESSDNLTSSNMEMQSLNATDERRDLISHGKPYPNHGIFKRSQNWAWWPRESIAWLLSALLLLVTAIVLVVYDQQPPPQLDWGITLNTIVSILATFSSLFLMIPVTACLGQSKWAWFRKPRMLQDFGALDEAARGPTGSLALLFKLRGGFLASLGAALTLLILGYGPFLQQIVDYGPHAFEVAKPSLPISSMLGFTSQYVSQIANSKEVDPPFKAAFYNALFSSQREVYPPKSTCINGNCTWDLYTTLGICSACNNLTSQIITSYDENSSNSFQFGMPIYTLGDAVVFPSVDTDDVTTFNTSISINVRTNVSEDQAQWSDGPQLINMTYIAVLTGAGGTGDYAVGGSCALSLCVHRYTANDTGGNLRETLQSSSPAMSANPDLTYDERFNASIYTQEGLPYDFSMDAYSAAALAIWASQALNGTIVARGDFKYPDPSMSSATVSLDNLQALYSTVNGTTPVFGMPDLFDNIANSLTYAMRVSAIGVRNVDGTAKVNEILVNVAWAWITFPAVIEILALILLIYTIVDTRKRNLPKWSDSGLAMMFHGLDARTRNNVGEVSSLSTMGLEAKGLRVALISEEGSEDLMLRGEAR